MKPLRYAVYVRKSTEDEERQVLSLSAQKDKAKERFSDLVIVKHFEESKSAFEPDKRPEFQKMLSMLDKGEIDGIIAWHPDRLSRNEVDASAITWRIRKGTIKDLKFASGFTFENTPEGMMMLQMTMSQSQYFSAKLSKDIRRGNEQKRKLGELTGRAPEGYLNYREALSGRGIAKIIKDPERFPLIRKAFDLFLSEEYSVQSILRIMNEDWGYRTLQRYKSGGSSLSRTTLYNIFRNVRYVGLVPDPYEEGRYYKGNFPAMITAEEYDRVQSLLGAKGKPRLCASMQFVLRGFIQCGECGCMITAERKTKKLINGKVREHIYYHCTHKRPCSQRTNVKEKDLFDQLNELLEQYELSPKLYEWGMEALSEFAEREIGERNDVQGMQTKAITETEKQLDTLLDMATKGLINNEAYKAKSDTLEADLKRLQEEQADTAARTKNWYEFVGDTLQLLTDATYKFVNGDLADKKEILLAIGQNPVILDGKMQITSNYWLHPIAKSATGLRAELEMVRTLPQQIQKASEEAIRLKWCWGRDSNPRRRMPTDLQSAVFDRFTTPAWGEELEHYIMYFENNRGKPSGCLLRSVYSLSRRLWPYIATNDCKSGLPNLRVKFSKAL